MPISISGDGTITGVSVGGLPNGIVDTDMLATSAVSVAKLSTGKPEWTSGGDLKFNSGYGSVATAYGVRAWVNFNGSGTVSIREDGNVSSITDNGTGDYTVNFTTAMPDANYAVIATSGFSDTNPSTVFATAAPVNSSSARVETITTSAGQSDRPFVCVAIIR
jgi:hypothetical protein